MKYKKVNLVFDFKVKHTTGNYIYKILSKNPNFLGEKIDVSLTENDNIYKLNNKSENEIFLSIDSAKHFIFNKNFHPKAIWLIDTHLSYFCDEIMAKTFDIIFVAQKNDAERMKNKFKYVYWLPLACDSSWHCGFNNIKKYDVAFIGNLGFGTRKSTLLSVKERYPNSFIGNADCEKIGEIYSQSKIVVNFSIKNDINMRIFEGMCSGSMVITNKINDIGFKEIFKENENIVLFESLDDLFSKIDFYLKNDSLREIISKNGQSLVLKNHTYENRAKFIIEKIENLDDVVFRDHDFFYFLYLKINLFFRDFFWHIKNRIIRIFDIDYI